MTMTMEKAKTRPVTAGSAVTRGPYLKTDREGFLARLSMGIANSRERMAPFHRQRVAAIRQWCGPRYGDQSDWPTDSPVVKPLATLFSYFSIVMPALSAHRLFVRGVGAFGWFDDLALRLAALTQRRIDELDAATNTLEPVIADVVFGGWGVSKIGIEAGEPNGPECEDWIRDPGEPYWSRVSPERFHFDPHCTDIRAAQWMGDEYYLGPYELGRRYGDEALARMMDSHARIQVESDESAAISQESGGPQQPLYPMFRLAEVWLPRENAIVTIPADSDNWSDEPLEERQYRGPEGGLYDMLAFERPPDNPLGVSVIGQLMDMDSLINEVMSKVAWRVAHRKDITVVNPGNTKTGFAVRDASDGEVIEGDANAVKGVKMGGADAADWTAISQIQSLQNYYAGNPEVIGGMAADAETLGQDQLKYHSATTKLGRWANKALAYANRNVRRIAWYLATRPMVVNDGEIPQDVLDAAARASGVRSGPVPIAISLPDGGDPVMSEWRPIDAADAEANFLDMNITIDTHAASDLTPEQQYQATRELVSEVAMPMAPILAAQGIQIDIKALVSELASYRNLRNTHRWFKSAQPVQTPGMASQPAGETTQISLGGPRRASRAQPPQMEPEPTSTQETA